MDPLATIVITTRNRRNELRRAVQSAICQTVPVEVLVIDDGSTDGTAEMVRAEFPTVRLERSDESLGYIVQRNRAAQVASGAILFSIDDDAIFSTARVVEQTLRDFDDPRIGAVAVPYLEPNKSNHLLQSAPDNSGTWITSSFIGTAHALRREIFLHLGGYRDVFFHQGEEQEFCIRMLQAGFYVRLGNASPVYHYECPRRDLVRMKTHEPRNLVLFAWFNVPMPYLPGHLLVSSWKAFKVGLQLRVPHLKLLGLARGYFAILNQISKRRPVSIQTYKLFRRLRTRGPVRLREVSSSVSGLEK